MDRFKYVRAEREAAAKTQKYFNQEETRYSDEQLAAIDEAYEREQRRGDERRFWEDVNEGDELTPMVKGPLTFTDIIVWMRGWGGGVNHSRMGYEDRKRRPGFFSRNTQNAWDVVERVHWEEEWARKIGNPHPYDFGRMRCCFLSEALTNWMGDDAWLWKLSTEFRRFNYVGDTTWVKGRVVSKRVEDGRHIVELEVWCKNQRDEVTAPGHAAVVLPSRGGGPLSLPAPTDATEGTVPLLY